MFIPAKTNLYLTVGALREEDRRHEIRTIFLPIPQLRDQVVVTPCKSPGITLEETGRPAGCPVEKNLVYKTVRLFCQSTGISPDGWHVRLDKAIPVSAGLGGGSADAAATLLEMSRITGCQLKDGLTALAARIGADVPFFLDPRPAAATGIGDVLTPLPRMPEYAVVVVYPQVPSPVAWAYRHWERPAGIQPPPWPIPEAAFHSLESLCQMAWNDLEFQLLKKYPALQFILDEVRNAGALAAMVSGSGSSLVGICHPHEAESLRQRLRLRLSQSYPQCQVL